MTRFLCVALVAALAVAVSAQEASTNYNAGDHGRSESVSPDGTVTGQYSYTGGDGKVYTVKYRAGKDGYQVEGDHLPRAPQPQAQQAPQQQQQQFYNPQQQQQPQQNFNNQQEDGSYNPIHHTQYEYRDESQPQQQPQQNFFNQQPQQYQNSNSIQGNVNNYNPFNFQNQNQPQQYQPQQQQYQPQQQQYQPQPQQQNYNNQGDEDGSYNPVHHTQYAYRDDSNQY